MKTIKRKDIQIFAEHSNLSRQGIERALEEEVYLPKKAWDDFFRIAMLVFGVGFLVLGLIFFFAYNWQDLHKFVKLGIIEGLLILSVGLVMSLKVDQLVKTIILTGSAMIVGALFAVFGQIYQTGADAYDFFLGWTIFVAIWTFVSNFPPLWILFIVLLNTSFGLYAIQVAENWSLMYIYGLFILGNSTIAIVATLLNLKKKANIPAYFIQIVSLGTIVIATIGYCFGIYQTEDPSFKIALASIGYSYALGIWYGISHKKLFFLSTIPFSLIIMTSATMFKASENEEMILMIGLFIIISVTALVWLLINFQRKNRHEQA